MKETAKSVKICCNECKHEFSMSSVNIEKATVNVNGQVLKLVYFACSKCNKIYRISLEDKRYKELVEDLKRAEKKVQKNFGSENQELARVLNNMVIKKHERLKNHLKNLDKKYPGTFTFVASENNHEDKIIKYLP